MDKETDKERGTKNEKESVKVVMKKQTQREKRDTGGDSKRGTKKQSLSKKSKIGRKQESEKYWKKDTSKKRKKA